MHLRLYHLAQIKTKHRAEVLEEVRIGLDTYLDVEGVESEMRQSLIRICEAVVDENGERLSDLGFNSVCSLSDGTRIDTYDVPPGRGVGSDMSAALDNVCRLWSERKTIARKLKTGISAGQKIRD